MKRERFEEVIKILNAAEIYDVEEDSFDIISADEWGREFKDVASDLNIDKRRHYETSERIWKVGEWYMGERYVSHCYNEMCNARDTGVTAKFYEVERIEKVAYEYKKIGGV